jgi:hypothetical protein
MCPRIASAASAKSEYGRNGVILNGYDVVAYFTQHKAIKGMVKYQTTYQGAQLSQISCGRGICLQ